MRLGIVGATGQVGGVMMRLVEERGLPVDELRLFASSPLGWPRGAGVRTRGGRRRRRAGRLCRVGRRPVLRRRGHQSSVGAAGGRGRRCGDRQLLGLACPPGGATGGLVLARVARRCTPAPALHQTTATTTTTMMMMMTAMRMAATRTMACCVLSVRRRVSAPRRRSLAPRRRPQRLCSRNSKSNQSNSNNSSLAVHSTVLW